MQLADLRAKAVAAGVSLSALIRQAMARTQTWTAPDCDTIMHRGADGAIERVAGLAIPEATVNSHVLDEVRGDRTVEDPQDLAQHLALGTEQERQRLAKVNTDHQIGCFPRTGFTRCTALFALDHPICNTRRAEGASFARETQLRSDHV